MCIDIFAPGSAVTLEFLHEQVWLSIGENQRLHAQLVCDAFLCNESEARVDSIRIQFPQYIDIPSIEVLSQPTLLAKHGKLTDDPLNQIAKSVTYDEVAKRIEFDLEVYDTTLQGQSMKKGSLLHGVPPGNGLLPVRADKEYLQLMKSRLNRLIVDLPLTTPLISGETGWLRLRTPNEEWPKDGLQIKLPGSSHLLEATDFLARAKILGARNLRDDLAIQLRDIDGGIGDLVIDRGWRKQGTRTRVEDHRISIYYPPDIELAHQTSIPSSAVLSLHPAKTQFTTKGEKVPAEGAAAEDVMLVSHFATGSNINRNRDLVTQAQRIRKHIERQGDKHPELADLVDHFAGDSYEAVDILIEEMCKAEMLLRKGKHVHVNELEQKSGLLTLRRRYTFPQVSAGRQSLMRAHSDMHAFVLPVILRWKRLTEQQQQRERFLTRILDWTEARAGTRSRRRAIVISSGDFEHNGQAPIPELQTFAHDLCEALRDVAKFDPVKSILEPSNGGKILKTLEEELASMERNDLLLLWYVGHGEPIPTNEGDLELITRQQDPNQLRWSAIRDKLKNAAVDKLVVLDCCYAARASSSLPHRTFFVRNNKRQPWRECRCS